MQFQIFHSYMWKLLDYQVDHFETKHSAIKTKCQLQTHLPMWYFQMQRPLKLFKNVLTVAVMFAPLINVGYCGVTLALYELSKSPW